jgi:hypothetical protein
MCYRVVHCLHHTVYMVFTITFPYLDVSLFLSFPGTHFLLLYIDHNCRLNKESNRTTTNCSNKKQVITCSISPLFAMAFIEAARVGDLDRISELLRDPGVDPAADDNCAIREASGGGHLSVVERLLQDARVDPAAYDNKAIREASHNGYLLVVERLLQDERVDPAADDNYAIRQASHNGYLLVVERLLQDARVDPAASDNYAIRKASCRGHLSVVDRLLQHPRVNATCLHAYSIRVNTAAAADQLSLPAVQCLAATLALPFPADSRILAWQPRIRAYHEAAVALAAELTANWRLHGAGAGVSGEVMEDIVWPYCYGLRLPQFGALDSTPPQPSL